MAKQKRKTKKRVKTKAQPVQKVDTYHSGESDVGGHLPAKFEDFFSRKKLFIILLLLVVLLLLSEILKKAV